MFCAGRSSGYAMRDLGRLREWSGVFEGRVRVCHGNCGRGLCGMLVWDERTPTKCRWQKNVGILDCEWSWGQSNTNCWPLYVYRVSFFFIVNVTEREFLFLILVGETFFFLMTRVATFATAIFFFFFLKWPGKDWEKFVEGRRDSFVRNDENWRLHKTTGKNINFCGQTRSPRCRFLYVVWVVGCMLRIAEMMMKKMMMLQVSPISLSFVSHKTIVAYLPNETEGKKKKCCPLFTTSSTVLLPHLRESTLFFFFFFLSRGPFWRCVIFQHESFCGPAIQLGLRRHPSLCHFQHALYSLPANRTKTGLTS